MSLMAYPTVSKADRAILAKIASGYQLAPPGAVVIIVEPARQCPQREASLKSAIAECASLMESFSDELHGDFNRRPERQSVWACPACAQVARVRRAPLTVVNPLSAHPLQRNQESKP